MVSESVQVPPAAADPAKSTKVEEPPPEKPSDITRRSYIVLSFWFIVLLIGVPLWWKTTTIYRADLPLDDMLQWAEGKVCIPCRPTPVLQLLTFTLSGMSSRLPPSDLH